MSDGAASAGWREPIPDDEARRFAAYVEQMRRYQLRFADRGDGRPRRAFHVKSHAGLRGALRVLGDIPSDARHGVFGTARTFDACVRLTNGFSAARPDWFPDLLGCSVKLLGVEGARLSGGDPRGDAQDFLGLNQPSLPADDAGQLMVMLMSAESLIAAPLRLVRGLGAAQALRVMAWSLGWGVRRLALRSVATEDFTGDAPITLGPHAVKFTWRSRQTPIAAARGGSWRNYLRADLTRRLAAGDLRWDFLVQFYVDRVRTPIDGAREWRPADAPFVKLAELTIPRCDLDTPEALRGERLFDAMSFSPWNGIAAHRPIGNIQRARRAVYAASARHWGADPGAAA